MPWQEIKPMDEKIALIAAILAQDHTMSELCASFGVSRKTAYKWWRRYRDDRQHGLCERSRAPHRVPWAIAEAQAQLILALRYAHPSWGPRKLRAKLSQRHPQERWPAPSSIGGLLHRKGLIHPRKRRRHAIPTPAPLTVPAAANDLWCIDFKGWFRTADGARCDPLTISDGYSRFLLCAEALAHPDYASCRTQLERVFREYGLPHAIRSDNGAPFASLGAGGLSRLAVWWIKLGITPERIEPGKPEQNGRHERMHRTLKAETVTPPAATLAQQQARFDRFRTEFNCERPHEALGQTAPQKHYARSLRRYPARLEDPVYPADYQLRRVRSNGEIKWAGDKIFISMPLAGEIIGIKHNQDGDGELYFGTLPLAIIDRVTLRLRRSSPSRRGGQPASLSSQPS